VAGRLSIINAGRKEKLRTGVSLRFFWCYVREIELGSEDWSLFSYLPITSWVSSLILSPFSHE
jgi:hypothetical protein